MVYKIAVIPGDGTGPEVIREGLKVLDAVAQKHKIKYETVTYDFGGERYKKSGEAMPDSAVEELKKFDTIYLGAIGHPDVKPGILEHGILLKLRFALDQYINLRPVKLYPHVWTPVKDKGPEEIDFVVVRENTEGLYVGTGGFLKKGTSDEVAIQVSTNTRKGVERCLRFAYEYCRKRNKTKTLTLVGKTNVLTYAFDLWERTFHEIGKKDYSDIKRDYAHVAMVQGGMGIAAGGNINPEGVSMFEPIGGSAPKYTGKNVINPLAAIGALQMLLENLGEEKAAADVEKGIIKTVSKMPSLSAGKMGMSTTDVGNSVASSI
jgi:3-isopropylmalate dehydrogenase